ncbi:MAG: hypothetical protein Q7S10_01025 [bacterium]|nr:hypothetical protein [bacterium]
MNIRKSIITTIVSFTLVALIAPVSVGAITAAELQAQINALMAQLQMLQPSSGTPAVCVGITFTRNLRVGSVGADVRCFQALMNGHGFQLAASGAGSPGNETSYFGLRTLGAVQRLQAAQGWIPASQVGPLTRALFNSWLSGSPSPTPTPTPTPVPTGAGLSVMLASNNPATGTIVDGQALAPLTALTFVNGDNAPVKVTGLKLKRIGVSADASLTNVYLFNGATRLTDGSAVSSTMVNFNNSSGLFTIPSMGSVTIWVLSDVDGTSGETVGLQVVSSADVSTNASSVKGTFPITGNLMTIATGTLAGVEWNATTTPSAASIDPQDGYTVFQNSVIVTTRAVDMTRVSFRKTGSAGNSDLKNFKLYVDGVQVGATMQLAADTLDQSYVTFDLSGAPKRLEAGTRVIKVLADIQGGSSLTFTMHLWNVADVTVVDTQYMANVLSDLVSNAAFTKRSSGEQTINSGTLTITKMTTSPSGDIVDAASNASLAKFELKAAGEKVKIETLYISVIGSASGISGLRNGAIYANGVQIGSTTTLYDPDDSSFDYTTFNLGSSLIVEPGSPVTLEVRADIYDLGTSDTTNSIVTDTTLKVRIEGASTNNNATGLTSSTTLDVPASDVDANTLTVKQGTLTLSKYTAYANHTVVAPITAYKIGHFTLTAATSEAVNVSAINVVLNGVSSYMTNLYVKYGTQTTSVKPTVATTNSWSINYNLPAGTTVDVTVYADVSSSMTSGTGIATVDVDGTTSSSAVAANSSEITGQTITYSSGAFTTVFDGAPQNQVVSGTQSVLAGRFRLTSSYRDYTVREMRFTANSNSIVIASATLKDNATGATLATVPYDNSNSYFNFTGLSVLVPASTSKRVDLYWNLISNPSATDASWNLDTKAILTYVKRADSDGTETITDPPTASSNTANKTIVYRAVPVLAKVALTSSNLINGAAMDLYKFTVTAPSQGPVHMKQVKIDLNWSDAGTADTLELESLKLFENGVDITSTVAITEEDNGLSAESTTGVTEGNGKIIITWDDDTEESTTSAGTSTTYVLRGTPQGFNVLGATDTVKDGVSLQFMPDTDAQTAGYNFLNLGTSLTTIVKLYSSSTANASAEDANLLWSDESAVAHSPDDDDSTKDWSNSYLFTSVDSQSWSY